MDGAPLSASEADLLQAFPTVDPGVKPLGSRVLVQVRTPQTTTKGGLFIPDSVRESEKWNTTVAKVISIGPLAFHNRNTLEPWPEGDWCQPGEFVRVPKYGGDRWEMATDDPDSPAHFVIYNDLDIIGLITVDPLLVKAYI